jgi:hypothetical protein
VQRLSGGAGLPTGAGEYDIATTEALADDYQFDVIGPPL